MLVVFVSSLNEEKERKCCGEECGEFDMLLLVEAVLVFAMLLFVTSDCAGAAL